MSIFDQREWDVRFEWGTRGVEALAPISDVVVIVDVLRFTTTVSMAVDRGALVYPYPWKDSSINEYAQSVEAQVAGSSPDNLYSLSPLSMKNIPIGTRLVLPSPNGSALSFEAQTGAPNVLAGCLRNAKAIAQVAQVLGRTISVIASGERWKQADELRPAIEDLAGAGAIVSELIGTKSPEAQVAETVFVSWQDRLQDLLRDSSSGKELAEMSHSEDVQFASQLNVSSQVPILIQKAFTRFKT